MSVCAACGVEVVAARNGRTVHTDAIPRGYAEHDAVATSSEDWAAARAKPSLRSAAVDMLMHHVTGHPESDCAFARNLRDALEME